MNFTTDAKLDQSMDELSLKNVKEIIGEPIQDDSGKKQKPEEGERRVLLVARTSRAKQVAGSIARTTRDSCAPMLSAVGPGSVNQAVKAIAISRTYLENDKVDLCFEVTRKSQDEIKDLIQFTLIKEAIRPKNENEQFQDLKSAAKSTTSALAGAIAKNIREKNTPRITAIGQKPVFRAICAIFQARGYLADDNLDITVYPAFTEVTFENGNKANAIALTVRYHAL
uniref:Stage V sporulation protein S n=1 Tax=Aplanochytrium stocchinoi TaxID=215587 RepID=A0A7S3LSX6_9STRA|mmetsp:Transcript_17454/g.21492  ORF Transcript_17454/g.21492 Transcript_17454/m.21492 type:complete len:226 (+) Transcript_17454:219-896(+)|eukprot:CAMPEP_0204834118 /NCGR_PEP_ID=MMETSP1346-20131115/18842_1 /ASSEMBLY_ACC=CAM_ASM_000771 /TAXON_ID=215587 /ORGANISM="Aplanochytrium stocchinoi, Strain GSBS06" /LENGTH=225 /DNA_ID=CAMNT_0051967169 /DNA_START=83 /DNA_END=760 /DNA_ORIENTATION=-